MLVPPLHFLNYHQLVLIISLIRHNNIAGMNNIGIWAYNSSVKIYSLKEMTPTKMTILRIISPDT